MNIKEAKTEIKHTIELYLEKDKSGEYIVPVVRQRPIFLIGAPGIGKTAIMEQIAAEMDIALVSYSMTHHTRQSAIGLPYLAEKEYAGRKCTISEYTMSEIIASIYEVMEKSQKSEGILFLDEINCVSETLAPSMLLFLQYKRFGNEQIPQGWVIVTAGNPPQYNKSVREFDVVTLDRLKYMTVEENYHVWKQYASSAAIHPAILAFLDLNESCFYQISTTMDGKQYITARGWEDLSTALRGYENHHFEITSTLILQYITVPNVARQFAAFYSLFQKYRSNYAIQDILAGNPQDDVVQKAKNASFDERISVISLFRDMLCERFRECILNDEILQKTVKILRKIKKDAKDDTIASMISRHIDEISQSLHQREEAGSIDREQKSIDTGCILLLSEYVEIIQNINKNKFKSIQTAFAKRAKSHEKQIETAASNLANTFRFIRNCWPNGQEMVLFVTELTMNLYATGFISRWGSDDYYQYNRELLVYDQDQNLKQEIEAFLNG